MAEPEDIQAQRELLQLYRRNLAHHLRRQALLGGAAYVTPDVANGIAETRREVARVKAILRGWGQPVEDLPDDAAPGEQVRAAHEPAAGEADRPEPTPTAAEPAPALDADGLEEYFTDVEHLRNDFEQLVAGPLPRKPLLIIHGLGGAGKSSLLRMFRLHARRAGVPLALTSGDEVKAAAEIIAAWYDDLLAAGVALPTLTQALARYRGVQTTVARQAQAAAGLAQKAALKTTAGAAGAASAALGSVFPLIGTAPDGAAAALVDWLGGFLKPSDIALLLDPTGPLTAAFLADLRQAAPRRLVLMLDTFEQIGALEDWTRDLAQRLPAQVLMVIAGRAPPAWERAWPAWMARAQVEELKPMTPKTMRKLVGRYYATVRGGKPDPAQVAAIIEFARGLPIVVTSAVQLWVRYGVENFQAVRAQVVADLVDRLLEGVPRPFEPVLEAAAALRWLNKDILTAVAGLDDVDQAYDELRRFPFVRPHSAGLALHDAIRTIIEENMRIHAPERYRKLHERAASFFERERARAGDARAEELALDQLYHQVRADEAKGMALFQQMAEELVRYRLLARLRSLLSEAGAYSLEQESSRLWRAYYHARLAHLEGRVEEAEQQYARIAEAPRAEPKLRAYALCDQGEILAQYQRLAQTGEVERAIVVLERGLGLVPMDMHLCEGLFHLGRIARHVKDWDRQAAYLKRASDFLGREAGAYGLVYVATELKRVAGRRGQWKEFIGAHERAERMLAALHPPPLALKARLLGGWAYVWALAGRYARCERICREALAIFREQKSDPALVILHDLGWALGVQRRAAEADRCFSESLAIAESLGETQERNRAITLGFWGACLACCGQLERARELLTQSLEMRLSLGDRDGSQEPRTWLALVAELRGAPHEAGEQYAQALALQTGRDYFQSAALTGLVRVRRAQGRDAAIPALLAEAEQLAQQHEYNDHLAWLRLTQGHLVWDGRMPEWGSGFDAALGFYQQALIYALRYNRFLLDELLWGDGGTTPLQPIIPHCLERALDGQRMLAALRGWWQTGSNNLGTDRGGSIAPIAEGIPLVAAEQSARRNEPGDGAPRRTVLAQLEAHLDAGGAWQHTGQR